MKLIGVAAILLAIQTGLHGYEFGKDGRMDLACHYMLRDTVVYGLPVLLLGVGWELIAWKGRKHPNP